jgi:signal transduction histidine kinase
MTVTARLRTMSRRRPHADVAVAVIVLAATWITTATGPVAPRLDLIALLFAGLACGALVFRQRFPLAALLLSACAAEAFLFHLHGRYGTMILAAPLIALYTVADLTTRRRALIIGALAVLAFGGLHTVGKPASWLGAENVALAALGGLAIAAGTASQHRRAYLAEVEARARHAEMDREFEAARRVTEERLRIARDLHDAVGHQLTVIHVQAGVAAHVLTEPQPQARDALQHIRAATKTALAELSETVGLLRQPGEPSAPTEPLPGLSGLDELLGSFTRAGLDITHDVEGQERPIPVVTDLTAYRVIQESLTNVCKHAGPTAVALHIGYHGDALHITVENRAPQRPSRPHVSAAPHGIVGMRERVTTLGGSLAAGLRPDGGFRVSTVLPLPPAGGA